MKGPEDDDNEWMEKDKNGEVIVVNTDGEWREPTDDELAKYWYEHADDTGLFGEDEYGDD